MANGRSLLFNFLLRGAEFGTCVHSNNKCDLHLLVDESNFLLQNLQNGSLFFQLSSLKSQIFDIFDLDSPSLRDGELQEI